MDLSLTSACDRSNNVRESLMDISFPHSCSLATAAVLAVLVVVVPVLAVVVASVVSAVEAAVASVVALAEV